MPKKGNKTRLIFHLSHNFSDNEHEFSLNYHTPKELCSTKYNDLDAAVRSCLYISGNAQHQHPLVLAKTDLVSAFRMLPIVKSHWKWLVFKAKDPLTGKTIYFFDKCLPFGASISCSHYQRFSNAIKAIAEYLTGKKLHITNYLDDFLFVELTTRACNRLMSIFLNLCSKLGVPVSEEKTEWGSQSLVFLGILIDGTSLMLCIPLDKRTRVLHMLQSIVQKKKATVKQLQQLTGHLNFLSRAIFPGRAFTRQMYTKFTNLSRPKKGVVLKSYHHVRLDQEFKFDCQMWLTFLSNPDD